MRLSYFDVGERVNGDCRVDGAANTLLGVESDRYSVGADGSVEPYLHGSVSATSATSVSVTATDSTTVSCSVPAGTDLSNSPSEPTSRCTATGLPVSSGSST
jgi:hypothetical protein